MENGRTEAIESGELGVPNPPANYLIRDFELSAYRLGYLDGAMSEARKRLADIEAINDRIAAIGAAGEVPALERKRAEEFAGQHPTANGRDGRD